MKVALIAVGTTLMLSACQNGQATATGPDAASPNQPRAFTQTTMLEFGVTTPPQGLTSPPQGLTSPPQGLTSPPQGLTSPPQGLTSPPQGITTPPLGLNTPLERSQFDGFDADNDGYWNVAELDAYVQARHSLGSFATAALSFEARALMDTYDRSGDRRLDYPEASTLHKGLGQKPMK